MSSRPPAAPTPKTKFALDFSGGVNVSTSRQSIQDNQAWWLEGAIPIAPGNLTITQGPLAGDVFGGWHTAISGESGAPSFVYAFAIGTTDYLFAVWSNSGNGYIGTTSGTSVAKYFSGTLTSGTTAAAVWNSQGILIIDPTGYWDWNITTASTLTAISQSVQEITISDGGVYTSAPSAVTLTGGGGSGALAGGPYMGIGSAIPLAGSIGSGYKVGDVLTFNFTFALAPGGSEPQLTVTTVNATGGVTGLQVTNPGQGINVGGACPATSTLNGGAGTGAQATLAWTITLITVATRGHGYTSAPSVGFTGGTASRGASAIAVVSGSLVGTAIAAYAGRAWIGNGRGITFTDADAYSSFVGSGSSFIIQDSYLVGNISALFAANDYLYIFGISSIDVLSNVSIDAGGDATFSRVNVSASIGCNQPNSIFSYYRAVQFANSTGFYSLSGASPQKISDALDLLVAQIDYGQTTNVTGGVLTVAGEICAAWTFHFNDVFIGLGAGQTMTALYFNSRWFFVRHALSGTPLSLGPLVSQATPLNQVYIGFTFDSTPKLYGPFQDPAQTYFRVLTKLYDCDKPMWTKQATRAAAGVQMGGLVSSRSGLGFTVDDENTQAGAPVQNLPTGTFSGYKRFMGTDNQGGGQFMGMTLSGVSATQADITRLEWLAFQYSEVTEWAA